VTKKETESKRGLSKLKTNNHSERFRFQ